MLSVSEILVTKGKKNGLILNLLRWELFCPNADVFRIFNSNIPISTTPNLEILGGTNWKSRRVCNYIKAKKKKSLFYSPSVTSAMQHSSIHLELCHCASFCKAAHLGGSFLPCDSSLVKFMLYNADVLHCLEE